MKITFGTLTIFDHAAGTGAALHDLDGQIARTLQEVRAPRAPSVKTRDRALKSTELRFSITRPNADAQSALLALFTSEAAIGTDSALVIMQDAISVTIVGNLRSLGLSHHGSRSFHAYAFTGGAPLIQGTPVTPVDDALKDTDGSPLLDTDGSPLFETTAP